MAIDMDNMRAGVSGQGISATGGEVDFGGGAIPERTIAACILRAEDVLDVGFVVTEVVTSTAKIEIGKCGTIALNADYFAAYDLTSASAVGTVFRTSDGTLSWAATADTEAERSCPIGTTVSCTTETGGGTGRVVPFVIMRPQGPLDPIA